MLSVQPVALGFGGGFGVGVNVCLFNVNANIPIGEYSAECAVNEESVASLELHDLFFCYGYVHGFSKC